MIRTYTEMTSFPTFEERARYLSLNGNVGMDTFGFDRYLNQAFYRSKEWRDIRRHVIIRDCGCDLAVEGYEIQGKILIHHMNPISQSDIQNRSSEILNPEYLVCVSHDTHNLLHYGADVQDKYVFVPRSANDTCPWKE